MQQMFEIALDDLVSARSLFEHTYPKQLAIICFLCQQCAEKSLKGYLHYKKLNPPRIHNMGELCKMCSEQDASFESIAQMCTKLTPFAVASRYPGEQEITEASTVIAIDRAQQIYDFCKAKVPTEDSLQK
jgi:HEPN domain-containing protein